MDPSLLLLADGRLPVGGHAYSAGAEAAIAIGDVTDLDSLDRFLRGRLATLGMVDAAFAARAATEPDDVATLADLDVELDARTPSPAARAVSRRLGRQLVRVARSVWSDTDFLALDASTADPHQAVATGVATSVAGGTPSDAAMLSFHHLAGAVGSAAVRLIGLDPVAVVAAQRRAVADAVMRAEPEIEGWSMIDPSQLPAAAATFAEILVEDHAAWEARLFVG